MKITVIVLVLLASFVVAEDKKAAPVSAAVVPALSSDSQNSLLRAQKKLDAANSAGAAAKIEWLTFVDQVKEKQAEIQKKLADASAASEKAEKDYQEAVRAAAKVINLDPDKYSLNRDTLVFSPLASPAPVTPSPEKK